MVTCELEHVTIYEAGNIGEDRVGETQQGDHNLEGNADMFT